MLVGVLVPEDRALSLGTTVREAKRAGDESLDEETAEEEDEEDDDDDEKENRRLNIG